MSELNDPETERRIRELEAPEELYRGFPGWAVVNAIVRARRDGVLMTAEEWKTHDSLAIAAHEDDAQRLRDLVITEDLGDFLEMSGKRPHEIGRHLIDAWQADIAERENEKSLAIAAAVQAERKEIMSGLLSLRHAVERVNEVNVAHGIGIAQTLVRDRPSPAVDVIGVVRELLGVIEAHEIESLSCDRDGEKHCECLRATAKKLRSLVDGAAAKG